MFPPGAVRQTNILARNACAGIRCQHDAGGVQPDHGKMLPKVHWQARRQVGQGGAKVPRQVCRPLHRFTRGGPLYHGYARHTCQYTHAFAVPTNLSVVLVRGLMPNALTVFVAQTGCYIDNGGCGWPPQQVTSSSLVTLKISIARDVAQCNGWRFTHIRSLAICMYIKSPRLDGIICRRWQPNLVNSRTECFSVCRSSLTDHVGMVAAAQEAGAEEYALW